MWLPLTEQRPILLVRRRPVWQNANFGGAATSHSRFERARDNFSLHALSFVFRKQASDWRRDTRYPQTLADRQTSRATAADDQTLSDDGAPVPICTTFEHASRGLALAAAAKSRTTIVVQQF